MNCPPLCITGETDEEDSDDKTQNVSTKDDHYQPGDEEGDEHEAAEHSA